jgi:hypothetical protein
VDSTGGEATDVQSLPVVKRTRIAASGDESVLVVALEMAFDGDEAVAMVLRDLLETRAGALWPKSRVAVLRPYVPGRSLLVLEVAADDTVDGVERSLARQWSSLISAAGEAELAPVKRRVAASASAEMSGVAGHARHCAATAAGASRWHQPAEFELAILTVDAQALNAILKGFSDLKTLVTTGAGALPIAELERR